MLRRDFLSTLALAAFAPTAAPTPADKLVAAARAQLGVTTGYDPRYTTIPYPNGDVPRSTGVCADVIVRAYRDALALDLQRLLHEDMQRDFAAYPRTWGMSHPDTNIDHRRVLNLETFWHRAHAQLWSAASPTAGDAFPAPLAAGDILTWRLDARNPHIGLVTEASKGFFGTTIRVVHNWGNGAEQSPLSTFNPHRAAGHFRWALT